MTAKKKLPATRKEIEDAAFNPLVAPSLAFFDVDLIISLGVAALLSTIKNPAKKELVKKIALKVRNAINTAYAGDSDFG